MGAQMVYMRTPVTAKESEDGGGDPSTGKLLYGATGMQGWRRNMEDAHVAECELDDGLSLFGVFDGHGGRGVSRFAAKHLPSILKETEAYKEGNYAAALERAFLAMDERLREASGREEVAELDRPDPDKVVDPVVVPKRVVQRFLDRQQMEAAAAELEGAETPEEASQPEAAAPSATLTEETVVEESVTVAVSSSNGEETVVSSAEITQTETIRELETALKEGEGEPEQSTAEAGEEEADLAGAEDEMLEALDPDSLEALAGEGAGEEEGMELDAIWDEDEDEPGEDQEMVLVDPSRLTRDPTPEAQGCTAVVVLVVRRPGGEGPRLICANAGDSRSIISRAGQAVALSEDHKPENDIETARIEKAGGYVQHMPGGARVMGDLNLSRAFGDLRYKIPADMPPAEQVLTAFPEVRTIPLTEEDEFMVLGCDGIWETATNQDMVNFVRPRLSNLWKKEANKVPAVSSVCEEICDAGLCPSMDDNEDFDGSGCDNMTVVVVQLKTMPDVPLEESSEPPAKRRRVGASNDLE